MIFVEDAGTGGSWLVCSRRVKEFRNFSEIPQERWRSRCTRAPSISTIVFKRRNKSQVGSMGSENLMDQIWATSKSGNRHPAAKFAELARKSVADFWNTREVTTLQQDQIGHAFTWFCFHMCRTLWDTLYTFIPSHSQKWDLFHKYDRTKVLPVTLKQKIK